ncbi:MAG TPA: hypothetical protein VGL13_02870 [Polyangiaceae bacterium]|jgi:hypothetical protein
MAPLSAWVAAMATAGLFAAAGCTDKRAPENIADQFVAAYFQRMDQREARQFTALGATDMLDRELELTRSIRADGYSAMDAAGEVSCRRRGRSLRGERVRFDYDIAIRHDETEEHRTADVELANIQSAWKVVRVDVKAREPLNE